MTPLPYGFYPFWFWNDRLSEDEIRWQIGEMAAQGVRGFFIHSRQGLRQPYLSEAFFRMVAVAVETAERHGMTAHLYDEYPYPSGVAGGEAVLGNPQYHAAALTQRTYDVAGGHVYLSLPRGAVLACVVCPLRDGRADWSQARDIRDHVGMVLAEESYNETGLTQYNRKRYFASQPTPTLEVELPEGPHRVFASVQTVVTDHKYWGSFIDVLNPEAVAAFLNLTHERYRQRFGEKFGGAIPSIFIDETEPGWSPLLPAAFRDEFGHDLIPLLPALQDRDHPDHLSVASALAFVRYELFCRNFEGPYRDWCARHGIRYTGEKPSLRLAQLRYMDIPGCDAGHTKAGARPDLLGAQIRGNARAAASAAYFYGREGALCEAYHSLGWSATLQDIKLIAEGLLLHGVPYLVPHGFFYSTHALKKHDAPPTFFFQMPYWERFGQLAGRIDRLARHLGDSRFDARILVVEPSSGLPTREQRETYRDLLELLMEEHREFLLVDTDILESGRVQGGRVHIREIAADVVILPPMLGVEPALQGWLDTFEDAGGIVLHYHHPMDRDTLAALVRDMAPASLRIEARSGDARRVQVTARRRGERRLWFILNTGGDPADLLLDAGCPLREVALDEASPAMLAQATGSDTAYRRTLAPFESILLEEAPVPAPDEPAPPTVRVPLAGAMRITPAHANLLRMYHWEMTVHGDDGAEPETRIVPAVPLANQLEKGRFRFAPAVDQFFGAPPRLRLPAVRVSYRFAFECAYDGPVELAIEPESIGGEWEIRINGGGPIGPDDLRPSAAHVRGTLGVDITALLRPGANEVVVDVRTERMDGGLRNALYLAGDFGVALEPLRLAPRAERGEFEAWRANGLPFYAGAVEYATEIDLDAPDGVPVLAELAPGEVLESPAEVSFNGGPWRPVLWNPRRVLAPPGEIRPGSNAVRLRVYTSLDRAFEGQWFDTAEHGYRDVGEGK